MITADFARELLGQQFWPSRPLRELAQGYLDALERIAELERQGATVRDQHQVILDQAAELDRLADELLTAQVQRDNAIGSRNHAHAERRRAREDFRAILELAAVAVDCIEADLELDDVSSAVVRCWELREALRGR